jgi:ubiquinone/menaquinone biosynthesis C-methylase UbiE
MAGTIYMKDEEIAQDVARHYDKIAWYYDISDWSHEVLRYRKLRPLLWSHAKGKTLDLGVGSGLNMPYYPEGIDITGVDSSRAMLKRAGLRAKRLGINVDLVLSDGLHLPFPDATFDSVISSFLFCVVPNAIQPRLIAEVARVLKPGARLALMEFVLAKNPWRRFWMELGSRYVHWMYRAGFDRKTAEFLGQGQWRIEEDRFVYQDVIRLLVAERPN